MSPTLLKIAAERAKQQERWDAAHDDSHARGELAMAAACYAVHHTRASVRCPSGHGLKDAWPFEQRYDRRDQYGVIHRLTVAAAFLIAEIERLERALQDGEPIDEN